MMISGFIAQVTVLVIIRLISAMIGGNENFHGFIAETVVPIIFFCLVGLPLFGFLFSNAYSPTEPVGANNQAEQGAASNGDHP